MKRNILIHDTEEAIVYSRLIDSGRQVFENLANYKIEDCNSSGNRFNVNYLTTRWRLEFLYRGRQN